MFKLWFHCLGEFRLHVWLISTKIQKSSLERWPQVNILKIPADFKLNFTKKTTKFESKILLKIKRKRKSNSNQEKLCRHFFINRRQRSMLQETRYQFSSSFQPSFSTAASSWDSPGKFNQEICSCSLAI